MFDRLDRREQAEKLIEVPVRSTKERMRQRLISTVDQILDLATEASGHKSGQDQVKLARWSDLGRASAVI